MIMTNLLSLVAQCPGYAIQDDDLDKRYIEDVRQAAQNDTLKEHVEKWSAFFRLDNGYKPDEIKRMELDIVTGNIDWDETKQCVELIMAGKECEHIGNEEPCYGVLLALPFALMASRRVAGRMGVPFCTALHQIFCDDPDHRGCF